MEENTKKCCCPCHKMMGIFVVLFGVTFLLGAFDVLSAHTVAVTWPVIVILAGLKHVCGGMCKCCQDGAQSCCK